MICTHAVLSLYEPSVLDSYL